MASPGLSELVTTTLRDRAAVLADNVSDNTALLFRLKQKGNVEPWRGGRTIVQPLFYAENGTFMWYQDYETLDITPQDVITAAEYTPKYAALSVSISGAEELQNSGRAAVLPWLESRIKNAEKSFMNNLSVGIYSDGTGSGGKQIAGLQALVADGGTGTVGGINSTTYSFWRNQVYDFSANSVTASSATIQHAMNKLWLDCTRNGDKPDLIAADNTYYLYYLESLQPLQRVENTKLADAGFSSLKYMSADVICDGAQGGDAPANHMYFLNTNYLHYRPHIKRNMDVIGDDRFSTNQDAMVRLIGWAGALTVSNRSLQGVIVA